MIIFFRKSFKVQYVKSVIQKIMIEHPIINWNPVDKSILILALGFTDQLLWLVWCTLSFLHPVFQGWLDLTYIPLHFTITIFNTCATLFLLIYTCLNKKSVWVRKYIPWLAVIQFALAFMYGGYSVGVCSPATVAGYISLFSVGMVLVERKVIYCVFFPITLFLFSMILLTNHGYIHHAPIFSEKLNQTLLSNNTFWVYSMMYFYIPIFIASIVLFEMLLSQWRNREKFFNTMSKIDPLTGVFNRRSISNDLILAQTEKRSYAVILLDLDYFKNINDNYGHDVGDHVLKAVAQILVENIRDKQDIVGRFGGEEFILILREKDLDCAFAIAERCRQEIERTKIILDDEQSFNVTASFGVAMSASHLTKEQVIKLSDQALYAAKQNGRNQVQLSQA